MADPIAVLVSGGLDSCILLANLARQTKVYPLYVRQGLVWEPEECNALNSFVRALHNRNVQPVISLFQPVRSLYGTHWGLTGIGIPTQDDPDIATYLPGRNVLLLSLAAVWCSLNKVSKIAIGALKGNCFPDATLDFFHQFSTVLSLGLNVPLHIEAPYRETYTKEALILANNALPLELTLSCMAPQSGIHCGQCNKCRERKMAYMRSGIPDRTRYVNKCESIGLWK
jgi:7-cyano-7-deazaguanine synthase